MPTAFTAEIQASTRKVFQAAANRVKFSRKARELHAAAEKLFTK
jgi:hypothetical protein